VKPAAAKPVAHGRSSPDPGRIAANAEQPDDPVATIVDTSAKPSVLAPNLAHLPSVAELTPCRRGGC
jgi:hypothetical protein